MKFDRIDVSEVIDTNKIDTIVLHVTLWDSENPLKRIS